MFFIITERMLLELDMLPRFDMGSRRVADAACKRSTGNRLHVQRSSTKCDSSFLDCGFIRR